MTPEDFWHEYVGSETPGAFLRRMGARDPVASVNEYMRLLPSVFGIAVRKNWDNTFRAAQQYTRATVRSFLICHLEQTRESWQEAVTDLPEAVPVKQVRTPEPLPDIIEEQLEESAPHTRAEEDPDTWEPASPDEPDTAEEAALVPHT